MFVAFLYFLLFYNDFYYLAKCIYLFDRALSTVKNCADRLFENFKIFDRLFEYFKILLFVRLTYGISRG